MKDYREEKLRAREEFAAQGDYLDFEEPLNERVVRNGEEVANLVRRVQTWYKARDYFVAQELFWSMGPEASIKSAEEDGCDEWLNVMRWCKYDGQCCVFCRCFGENGCEDKGRF